MWQIARSGRSDLAHIINNPESVCSKWRQLNAFITECWTKAQDDAEALSQRTDIDTDNALYGMPLAVKDNFCTKGLKTSCGSKMLDNFVSPYTATVVERLENKGMVVVGKTNMDSFAMGSATLDGIHGPAKNPWTWISAQAASTNENLQGDMGDALRPPDHDGSGDFRIAGGSSGGSAAAVAAGIVYGALGSDTGGSVRNPAAYCGVVGLKPTYGLLSRHGLIPLVNGFDCPGVLARTVQQCTHMLNAVAGHDPRDSTTYHSRTFKEISLQSQPSVKGLKVGIPKEYHAPHLSTDMLSLWTEVAEVLEQAGAIVEGVSLPHTQYSIPCYSVINCCDVASNMARYDGVEYGHRAAVDDSTEALYAQTRHEALTDVVRGRIFAGNFFLLKENYENYYKQAARLRRLIYNDFQAAFDSVDILLTPITNSEAPLYSTSVAMDNRTQCVMQDVYTLPSNLAGVPAISVPIKLSQNKLPLSVQLIGRHHGETTLLNAAQFIESSYKFSQFYADNS